MVEAGFQNVFIVTFYLKGVRHKRHKQFVAILSDQSQVRPSRMDQKSAIHNHAARAGRASHGTLNAKIGNK